MFHVRGNPKASVTLLEFGDYECDRCAKAQRVIQELMEIFGSQLQLAFKHFPMTDKHRLAEQAAEAAEAAANQGRFWQMHDRLFLKAGALEYEDLLMDAREIGIDVGQFSEDLRTHRFQKSIYDDLREGARRMIDSTPTFFVNEVLYRGELDVTAMSEAIQRAIDEDLIRIAI